MNNKPTPETERVKAAYHTSWDDLLNHARRLERERDEAREERDEARKEINRYREKLDLLPISWDV